MPPMTASFLTPQGRRIAFHQTGGAAPGVMFLGGYRSDMTGTKAAHLEAWAIAQGRAFLRFDYSGHGQSSGAFDQGAIGDWAQDAAAALALTTGPQVLVGSSMGGWVALLLARALPARVAGLVGIAAAPDFTEDSIWGSLGPAERDMLMQTGRVERPGGPDGTADVITRRLIEDGRAHLVLRDPLALPFPVRLLHGTADTAVPPSVAVRLVNHAIGPNLHLTLVKDADHRFSTPPCLALIETAVADVTRAGR